VVEVFDTDVMERIETVRTERGAHTLGFDGERNKVYAFLPGTHRAAVYTDKGWGSCDTSEQDDGQAAGEPTGRDCASTGQ
jgi:hypothetical protein